MQDELTQVAKAAHEGGALLKVIFENFYLTDDQIVKACAIAKAAGCDFIKTSTGYAGGGATMHDLQIMVDHADGMKVDDCLAMMAIGVVRCGTRASEAILKEAEARAARGELYLEQ